MKDRPIEWPTLAVAITMAAGLGSLLYWHRQVPTMLLVAGLALLGAWYNSLQHEVVHGHPTRWRWCNTALAIVPLGLTVPYRVYRETHLAHHRTKRLTDPEVDPESFHVTAETWRRAGAAQRAVLVALRTLSGRLVLGPPVSAIRWWSRIVPWVRSHPRRRTITIGGHVAGVVVVLWAVHRTGMPLWIYLVGFVWGGGSLSLLRSFVEHRAVPDDGTRSAVVRSNSFFSLLFLNNNLHHTHHARPRLAWYELPCAHDELRSDAVAAEGAGLYRGYAEIARRYLVRPFDHPVVHPQGRAAEPAPSA